MLADPERLRKLLFDELGLSSETEAPVLALPGRIPDWDADKVVTTGELVRALALHLGDVLAERTRALCSGSQATHADWSRSSAEALGLVRALQRLLEKKTILEKCRYLEIFLERHDGFRPPADAVGF